MGKLRCHISIPADGFVSLSASREAREKQGGEVNESSRVFEETCRTLVG
jgi:hypothetical protein